MGTLCRRKPSTRRGACKMLGMTGTRNGKRPSTPPHVRVLARSIAGTNGCIIFTGATTPTGYGRVRVVDESGQKRTAQAHRVVYEAAVGPIPDGLVIDHLCRTRACVNHFHLEAVTQRENVLRGDSGGWRGGLAPRCQSGHEYTDENTYLRPGGGRQCQECKRRYSRGARARRLLGESRG